jgi:low temperature requirement protein LtrA
MLSLNLWTQNRRLWWQPPRSTKERDQHRSVSFLELFYDLVYVVLISQVAHALGAGTFGLGGFILMFTAIWIAWLNGSSYHEIHANNDIRTRVFTFLQMFVVAAMALFTEHALSDGASGFALSYAALLLIMTFLWWRSGVYDPEHLPLSIPYIVIFLITAALFVGSIYVASPLKFQLWAVGVFLLFLGPVGTSLVVRLHPETADEAQRSLTPTHSLIERMDLLTIIVLGEVIVGVVHGLSEHLELNVDALIAGALGMTVAIGLWWLYFDSVAGKVPKGARGGVLIWAGLHLPLTGGIVATGAALLEVIGENGHELAGEVRWLLAGSIATVILSILLISLMLTLNTAALAVHRPARIAMLILALATIALGFTDIGAIPLLGLVAFGLLVPIYIGLRSWLIQASAERIR